MVPVVERTFARGINERLRHRRRHQHRRLYSRLDKRSAFDHSFDFSFHTEVQMKPLLAAVSLPPHWPTWSRAVHASTGVSIDELRILYTKEFLEGETWMNDEYVVIKTTFAHQLMHLSIRRKDRKACRDWRHFQEIKNQLCGKESEAVELYPAESRLVDTANQFHLWVLPEGMTWPCGYFMGRHVTDDLKIPGAVQRKLP
jgi:hypothetical protein